MRKYYLGAFICLLSIFLMSHNIAALSNYDALAGLRTLTYSTNNSDNCNNTSSTVYIQYIRTSSFDVHTGNMIFAIPFQNSENNNSLDAYVPVNMNAAFYISPGAGASVTVLDAEVVQNSNSQSTLYILVNSNGKYTNTRLTFSSPNYIQMKPHECIENGFVTDVGIDTVQLQDISGQLTTISNYLTWINTSLNDIKNRPPAPTAQENADAMADEEEERTQSASDDAQSGADDSSEEAEAATSGLISIIGGFVSAITNASPSNCNLNGNMGHLNMGLMDMCALPVPTFVQIIGSIILILVCIPFVIIMFNRFISLFRSFQG